MATIEITLKTNLSFLFSVFNTEEFWKLTEAINVLLPAVKSSLDSTWQEDINSYYAGEDVFLSSVRTGRNEAEKFPLGQMLLPLHLLHYHFTPIPASNISCWIYPISSSRLIQHRNLLFWILLDHIGSNEIDIRH